MKPAILYYPCTLQDISFDEWFGDIRKNITIITISSFNDLEQLIKRENYSVYILLTNINSFPSEWQFNELKAEKTIMILTGLNRMKVMFLNSFLDSIETYVEPSNDNPFFHQSLTYLEENICNSELSLEKVASQAYVSKCHYSRMFQRYVGKGFKEYVISKRIQKAKLLLQKGDTVTDVCFSIGYNDLTHFARMFKKIVGVNPSTYRTKNMTSEV
ncbi:AraC family transcriptional regulator [Bacillus sp. SM2101]|uniref:AraC family transcriptional regulator n=1 Tax=Bacillus sp. SM2101 TaxID=2805366 RepID=UPI001BDEAFC5|nr:AraC family transcriptional regulator [Bacillus sp. SM2101]